NGRFSPLTNQNRYSTLAVQALAAPVGTPGPQAGGGGASPELDQTMYAGFRPSSTARGGNVLPTTVGAGSASPTAAGAGCGPDGGARYSSTRCIGPRAWPRTKPVLSNTPNSERK